MSHISRKYRISIHALREEGDQSRAQNTGCKAEFLSTPSARRATSDSQQFQQCRVISIHALREEGDFNAGDLIPVYLDISIHALREEGDRHLLWFGDSRPISIHALREEGDQSNSNV